MIGRKSNKTVRRSVGVGVAVLAAVVAVPLVGASPAFAADTYGSCNYVGDWDRPVKKKGAGLSGSPDAYVKQIQCLINIGSKYPTYLTVDGRFGSGTDAAVRWVQSCNQTAGGVDGVVGSNTWLDLYLPDANCAL